MQRFFRLCSAVAVTALLAGCAGLLAERPRVNIASITPKEMKLLEQVFTMDLRIQNTGESEIAVNGIVFDLEINDRPFATGVSNQNLVIKPFSSQVVQAEAVTTLPNLLRQVAGAPKSDELKLTYRLRGTIHTGGALGRIHFDDKGEISAAQMQTGSGPARR